MSHDERNTKRYGSRETLRDIADAAATDGPRAVVTNPELLAVLNRIAAANGQPELELAPRDPDSDPSPPKVSFRLPQQRPDFAAELERLRNDATLYREAGADASSDAHPPKARRRPPASAPATPKVSKSRKKRAAIIARRRSREDRARLARQLRARAATAKRRAFLAKLAADGRLGFAPRSFDAAEFTAASWLWRDVTGRNIAAAVAELPAMLRARLELACFGAYRRDDDRRPFLDWTDTPARDWTDPVARRRATIAVVALRLSSFTPRRGYAGALVGFARGAWVALVPRLDREGLYSKRTVERDWQALELAGAFDVQQPPAHRAAPGTVGRDRDRRARALAVYYVPRSNVDRDAPHVIDLAAWRERIDAHELERARDRRRSRWRDRGSTAAA